MKKYSFNDYTNDLIVALMLSDGYKTAHHNMYPQGTEEVYSNFTPRNNKHAPKGCTEVLCFGQQMVTRKLVVLFDKGFFNLPKDEVCQYIKEEFSMYLGFEYDVSHFEALHDLGFLPLKIKALPEGTMVPMNVPVLTVRNNRKNFFWLTNYLETIISELLWKPMTSATIALLYRRSLNKWGLTTDEEAVGFVPFQGHDFSMRGMDSIWATMSSGLGHATCFLGSDSLPVIPAARMYYDAVGPVIHSVNATEHSVMCAGGAGEGQELATFRYLMKQFPLGILSIVSDTWNLWAVLTVILPILKDEIMARDGKIVIRPDSGNPVDIICGTSFTMDGSYVGITQRIESVDSTPVAKGVIELLWDLFGGTTNAQGYKVLDPHVGAIYGDAITPDRQEQICERLAAKGFASTNIVFGIGSFTYQHNTRDSFGFAMKATHVTIREKYSKLCETECQEAKGTGVKDICADGCMYENCDLTVAVGHDIFKDPVTGDGTKKSAKGYLCVIKENGAYKLLDQVKEDVEETGELQLIFGDGEFYNPVSLMTIRERVSTLLT